MVSISNRTLTLADRKDLAAKTNKLAITDHVGKENYVIDWSGAKISDRESHRKTRELKESICVRKEVNCMNRDGGAYNLPTTYDRILVTCSPLANDTLQLGIILVYLWSCNMDVIITILPLCAKCCP